MPPNEEAHDDAPAADAAAPSRRDQIRLAVKKLRGKDRVGTSGEVLSAAGGAAAGAAAAGAVAGAAGATTILGSAGLGGVLGGVFVASTPVGWVVGTAAVAGLAGYGIARLVRSGARQDAVREGAVKSLEERLEREESAEADSEIMEQLRLLLAHAVSSGLLPQAQSERMLKLVDSGALPVALALDRVRRVCESAA